MTKEQTVAMKAAQVKLCLRRIEQWTDIVLQHQRREAVDAPQGACESASRAVADLDRELAL